MLNDDFTDFIPWSGNKLFKEITPGVMLKGLSSSEENTVIISCGPREVGETTTIK